jgi:uncharacterized membrane protein YkvA (DUF1232 family)
MDQTMFEQIHHHLAHLTAQGETFEACYGSEAAQGLSALPALFTLYHRLAFDLEIPGQARRLASLLAIYIAEPADFCGEAHRGIEGLVDDLWLALAGLQALRKSVPEPLLRRHWRSERTFDEVLRLETTLPALKAGIPPRVFEKLNQYLAV